MRRGGDFSIFVGREELMNSRLSGSEEALAFETCRRLAGPKPRLLVARMGADEFGVLVPDATVVVAELVPAVVAWARGPLASVFAGSLDDPRVGIVEEDVAIAMQAGLWDAILLDVDNGPDGLVRAGNDGLYGARGLAAARAALLPSGLLSIWSVARDEPFAARFSKAGFAVEQLQVRANAGRRGARHTIWLGQKG